MSATYVGDPAAGTPDLISVSAAAIGGSTATSGANHPLKWFDQEHLIYNANKLTWEKNERRLRGGDWVLPELRSFEWETARGESIQERANQATYINFAEMLADTLVGHLFREKPDPDYGTLGKVKRGNPSDDPSRAEQLAYNCDGEGNDGSQWDTFWSEEMKWAMATGHRWILVDAPQQKPRSRADELDGLRPYLQGFSPLQVPQWHFVRGKLAYALIRYRDFAPTTNDAGEIIVANTGLYYMLVVRQGYEGIGKQWEGGGWWKFDPEKNQLDHGTYDATNGEIPLAALYYRRDKQVSISRPGLTELGQVAVSYMNLSSAADFDAWDAARSVEIILGADLEGFNLLVQKRKEGSRTLPLPVTSQGVTPSVHDSAVGAVPAEIFDRRLATKLAEADRLAINEATSEPGSSGASKRAGFVDKKAPRLTLMAGEIESCMNSVLGFIERLWTGTKQPRASVTWPRKFDLVALSNSITELFNMMALIDVQSATLIEMAIAQFLTERQIVTDEAELATIKQELLAYLKTKVQSASAYADRLSAAGAAGGAPPTVKPKPTNDPNTQPEPVLPAAG